MDLESFVGSFVAYLSKKTWKVQMITPGQGSRRKTVAHFLSRQAGKSFVHKAAETKRKAFLHDRKKSPNYDMDQRERGYNLQ